MPDQPMKPFEPEHVKEDMPSSLAEELGFDKIDLTQVRNSEPEKIPVIGDPNKEHGQPEPPPKEITIPL